MSLSQFPFSPTPNIFETMASMTATAQLTVAIPYYRNRHYLEVAVGSVIAQSTGEWLLVVSDGSGGADESVRVFVERLNDPRVRYLPSNRPLGMAENWNRCLDASSTDLVTLLHDDDRLLPDYIARMREVAAVNSGAAALFCEAMTIDFLGKPRFSFPDYIKRFLRPHVGRRITVQGELGLQSIVRGNFVMCPTLCYRRSRLGPRRFDQRWNQVLDLDLTSRLLLEGEYLVGLPDTLYAYRRHPNNTTASQTESLLRFREERDLYSEIATKARACGWRRAARTAQNKTMIQLHLLFRLFEDLFRIRWSGALAKARMLRDLINERLSGRGGSRSDNSAGHQL
jgi:glycosyltransferase involved in cell wall biosynthesis